MTALSATPLTSAPAMLRPLSGFERLFLALDKINGFNFGIAVSFSGTIADLRWNTAFEQVRRRHPLLNAGISEEDPHTPYFTCGAGLGIPLAFQRRISSTDWQRVMESEIAEPFDLSKGSLLRAAVLKDDQGCDLVITANHVIIDGMGVLAFIGDLLRALAGQGLAVPPAAEIRVMNPVRDEIEDPAAEPQPRNRTYASRNRKGKAVVSSLRLSQDQTAQLLRYARLEITTIGAMLIEEVIEVGKANAEEARLLQIPRQSPVFMFTRVSFRDNGKPVGHVKSTYRGDRYKIVNRLMRTSAKCSLRPFQCKCRIRAEISSRAD